MSDPNNMIVFVGDNDFNHYHEGTQNFGTNAFISDKNVN